MSDNSELAPMIEETLKSIWPTGDASIRDYLTPMIAAFAQSDCRDDHYLEELQSGDLSKVAARMWEALLYVRFHGVGWAASNAGKGPDFLLNGNVYVEAVTAQPGNPDNGGLPKEWQEQAEGSACIVPIEAMLLRWTSVLKTKKDKHLKDIEGGRVDPNLPFVIAVNSCRLGGDTHGVGGVPLAAMAVLPFGNPTAHIDVQTGEAIGGWRLAWQDAILKHNGESIPTDSFLHEEYSCVSALLGCSGFYVADADREKFCGQPPYYIVHNPMAKNPLPKPWLPNSIEFVVAKNEPGNLELACLPASAD